MLPLPHGLLDSRRVFVVLFSCALLLTLAYLSGAVIEHVSGSRQLWLKLFDMADEANIPAWFSSSQLLCTAIAACALALCSEPTKLPSPRFFWIMALAFLFFSLDESALIHERSNTILLGFDAIPRFPGNHGTWIAFYMAGALFALALLHRDILALWRDHRGEFLLFAAGSIVFVGGAVGLEIVSYHFYPERSVELAYRLEVAAEEFMEMLGANIILIGLLRLLVTRRPAGRPTP